MVNESIDKPCYMLEWCPYGGLVKAFRIRDRISKYTCKVFSHDCPVFNKAEYVSERLEEELKEDMSKNLNSFLL